MAVAPIVLLILITLFWYIKNLFRSINSKFIMKQRIFTTIVIVLFLIHPNIIQHMLYTFKCIEIDSDQRL